MAKSAAKLQPVLNQIMDAAKLGGFPGDGRNAAQARVDEIMTRLTGAPFRQPVCGYKLALLLPRPEEKTAGGIIRPDMNRDNAILMANAGLVLAVGPDAYTPETRYPSGPWCKVGDWVVFQRYSTTAALMGYKGVTIAIIPDDKIDMLVEQPTDVTEVPKRDLL